MRFNGLRHEIHVYVSNGKVVPFTIREMYTLYASWQVWVMIFFGFFVMATGHPVTVPQFDSFGLRLAFWFVALFVYLGLSTIYTSTMYGLWGKVTARPIPLLLLSGPLVLAATYMTAAAITLLFEPGKPPFYTMTWQMNVRNVLVAHVLETAALLWVLPALRMRQGGRSGTETVLLGGKRMRLDDIARVKAAEHYLEVYKPSGVEVVRERMSTFLDQVGAEDGIQTHRSHWVARGAGQSLSGAKLHLPCGAEVPVARARLDQVRAWVQDTAQGTAPDSAQRRAARVRP